MEDKKPLLLGVGISGLVGSRVATLLSDRFEFQNLSTDTGVDITKPETLRVIEENTDAQVVIHFAAKTDVDGCEHDRVLGQNGGAWKINVEGARNVAEACSRGKKKMLYISTDFVFDGTKTEGELYNEEDEPHPINWYGETKYEGEKAVASVDIPYAILRLAYPYRTPFSEKKDLVQAIKFRLEAGQEVSAVVDHLMSPTYVDDFASAIGVLIQTDATGIYHTVGSSSLSPFQLATLIAQTWDLDQSHITETTREAFFAGRANRPFNLSLNNAKIKKLGVTMKTVEEGLIALREQEKPN